MIGEIDDRYIAEAAPAVPQKRKPVWIKWGAIAACLVLAAAAGARLLHSSQTSCEPPAVNNGGLAQRYGNSCIMGSEEAMVVPWEYKTLAEQYTILRLDGREYVSKGMVIDSSLVGESIGVYRIEGYDTDTEKTYQMQTEVFENSGISAEHVVAVRLGEECYTFTSIDYAPPAVFGELLDEYNLAGVLTFDRFYMYDGDTETGYYSLSDDSCIWKILNDCSEAVFLQEDDAWDPSERNGIRFTATSTSLGVYKRVFDVTADGYIHTNIFDYGYLFRIGEEAAEKIISYAKENGTETIPEPYTNMLAGTITDISDGFVWIDDSVLCREPSDGMIFKVPLDDLRISRCIELKGIGVGDLVVVSFTGTIDTENGNLVTGAYSLDEGMLSDGNVSVPE